MIFKSLGLETRGLGLESTGLGLEVSGLDNKTDYITLCAPSAYS